MTGTPEHLGDPQQERLADPDDLTAAGSDVDVGRPVVAVIALVAAAVGLVIVGAVTWWLITRWLP